MSLISAQFKRFCFKLQYMLLHHKNYQLNRIIFQSIDLITTRLSVIFDNLHDTHPKIV